MKKLVVIGVVGLAVLSGCSTYQKKPLPKTDNLVKSVSDLQLSQVKKRGVLAPVLSLKEVEFLTLINNPDLRILRKKQAVSGAQLYAAGLLPDPQISTNYDVAQSSSPGVVNAWGIGMAYDIVPLITRQARLDSASYAHDKFSQTVLWQEWQMVQKSKILYIQAILLSQKIALVKKSLALFQQRYQKSNLALKQGNTTLDVTSTDLTAVVDATSKLNQLMQSYHTVKYDLHTLLGLAPTAPLNLGKLPKYLPIFSSSEINKRLKSVAKIRPDLKALQLGYLSQEEKVRAAILAQFPSISIGFNHVSDTGALVTNGLGVTLNLPIFSGNKGNIAQQRATREVLRQQYQVQLGQTKQDVAKLLDRQQLIILQQKLLANYVPILEIISKKATRVYKQGAFDALTFLNIENTLIAKQLEQLSLTQNQWQTYIAIETLLPKNVLNIN